MHLDIFLFREKHLPISYLPTFDFQLFKTTNLKETSEVTPVTSSSASVVIPLSPRMNDSLFFSLSSLSPHKMHIRAAL